MDENKESACYDDSINSVSDGASKGLNGIQSAGSYGENLAKKRIENFKRANSDAKLGQASHIQSNKPQAGNSVSNATTNRIGIPISNISNKANSSASDRKIASNNFKSFINNKRKNFANRKKDKAKKKAVDTAMKVTGKVIAKLTVMTQGIFLVVLIGLFLSLIISIAVMCYTDSTKEKKGAEGNYVSASKNKVSKAPGKAKVGEDGKSYRDNVIEELSPVNSAISAFYQIFASKSYYQISLEDGETLIRADSDDYKKDYYNRDESLAINYNFLYNLNEYLIDGFVYPEQFIKPVAYDKEKLELEDIVSSGGKVNVESDKIDKKSGKVLGKKRSLSDYGFGTVAKYATKQRKVILEGEYYKKDVWDEETQTVKQEDISEKFSFVKETEDIYLLDKVITFAGSVKYDYNDGVEKIEELKSGSSKNEEDDVLRIQYGTYKAETYEGTRQKFEYKYVLTLDGMEFQKVFVTETVFLKNDKGELMYDEHGVPLTKEEPVYETITGTKEHMLEEGFSESEIKLVDSKEYPLYKYRDTEKSGLYEHIPVIAPVSDEDINDTNTDYFYDYCSAFESYIPSSVSRTYSMLSSMTTSASSPESYSKSVKTSASGLNNELQAFIEEMGEYAREDMKESGILASVTLAQCIVESGWGRSSLAYDYNNYFGIKATSSWDGDVVDLWTKEDDGTGKLYSIIATWKVFDSVQDSFRDHSKILWNATRGNEYRYRACVGEKDYRTVIQIILDGGYGTATDYVNTICNVIECYDLTQFDDVEWDGTKPDYAVDIDEVKEESKTEKATRKYSGSLSDKDRETFTKFVTLYDDPSTYRKNTTLISKSLTKSDMKDILIYTMNFNDGTFYSEVSKNIKKVNLWEDGFLDLYNDDSSYGVMQGSASYEAYLKILPSIKKYTAPLKGKLLVTSHYTANGDRTIESLGIKNQSHWGTDFAADLGQNIYAVYDGTVADVGYSDSRGYYITIVHSDNTMTTCMHMCRMSPLSKGATVKTGTLIGYAGTTGMSTGVHLHIEWTVNGERVDMWPVLEMTQKKEKDEKISKKSS